MSEIEVGTRVKLIGSEGPEMVVFAIVGDSARCEWLHGAKRQEATFKLSSLERVPRPEEVDLSKYFGVEKKK